MSDPYDFDTATVRPGGSAATVPALGDMTAALEDLTAVVDAEDDFQVLVDQVCQQIVHAVGGVDEATVTLLHAREPWTAAATGPVVAELDREQYRSGDGPCLRAARTGKVVRLTVKEAEECWPEYARDAGRAGFGEIIAAPLVIRDHRAGTINCYSQEGHGFTDLDEQLIELYTTVVEVTLRLHQRYTQARRRR